MKKMVTRLVLIFISLILTGTFTPQSSAEVHQVDAAGIWLFDEGEGDVARDSSGKGNDGTLIGGPKWVEGKYGTALKFNGSKTSVEIEHDDSLNLGDKTDFTVVAWYTITLAQGAFIMSKTVKPWIGFEVKFNVDWITCCIKAPDGESCGDSGLVLYDGEFHHVAAVFSRTEGRGWVYIDGVVEGDPIDYFETEGSIDNLNGLAIGVSMADHIAGSFFRGNLDEVALFTTALSQEDVLEVMNGMELLAVSPSGSLTTTWGEIRRAF